MPGEHSTVQNVSQIELELHFLIARFLSAGPCKRAAKVLNDELQEHKLLPKRTDWQGQEHFQSYENLVQLNRHISKDHLLKICRRLGPLLDKEVPPSISGVRSLLGAGSLSLLRTSESVHNPRWKPIVHTVLQHQRPLFPPRKLVPPCAAHIMGAREVTGQAHTDHAFSVHMYTKVSMHCRRLGHLSAVYCVMFDRTGNYIFTGSDDHLVKVWSVEDGRLLATLRGQSAEITDFTISFENNLLAAGCTDKIIRVWCLKSQAPVCVLNGHSGLVTSLQFCPQAKGDIRYLLSTGGDGCVCFWKWNIKSNVFDTKPLKFIERSRSGAQMLCSSFSPGGLFLATGNTDHVIRVYFLHGSQPEKICELESHSDRVDSICYNNIGDRFISGSRDGTARIWRFDRQEWKNIHLNMNTQLEQTPKVEPADNKSTKLKVTMISWNQNDRFVITAVSDYSLKVWDSHTGKLLYILKSHEDEVFVLEHSPVDPRVLLSAGHDGKIIIWDLHTGTKVKCFTNMIEGQGHGAVFDGKFSPDGLSFAATDAYGQVLIFGFGSSDKYKKIPEELFFHTDYRPLIRDANEYVLDEQTQQAPHLMPPPFLVDIDGNPYPPAMQRLVPGRERCKSNALIPQVAVNEEGEQEVIGDVPVIPQPHEELDENRDERVILDSMIERLQREQDERIAIARGEPLRSPPPGSSPRAIRSNSSNSHMVGMRRSGETEGVRQSLGNIPQRAADMAAIRYKVLVRGLDPAVFRIDEEKRQIFAEEEIKKFTVEKKRRPLLISDTDSSDSAYMKTRKKEKSKSRHKYSTRTTENEETTTNRLAARALYDTEEEDEEVADGSVSDFWKDSSDESNNSETSECSDWVGDNPTAVPTPVKRSQRKRKRKKFSSSDEDNDDRDNDSGNEEDSYSIHDESKKEKEDSGSSDGRERRSKRKRPPPKKKKTSSPKKKVKVDSKQMKEIKELPEQFRPPDWLTDTIPRKSPYVPQMGDEVMYFRQGHELYVQTVKRTKSYSISKSQPWDKIPNLREQELVKIVGLRYEIRPPRLCCLKLAFLDPVNRKRTGGTFFIKYHDMPDVIDFMVLMQNYHVSIQRKWSPGDRFRSMIDDAWWTGSVESQVPFQPEYPDSMFQCFNVRWDNGELEKLSPWDLEPVDDNSDADESGGGQPVNPEELKSLMYTPVQGEWPKCGRNITSDRISRGLEIIMEHSIAEPFLTPVDLNAFPIYAMVIEYPIDLTTIKNRLENRFYRRTSALLFDIQRLSINAEKFNEPGTPIVRSAKLLLEILMDFIEHPTCDDLVTVLNYRCKGQEFLWNANASSDSNESGPSSSRPKKGEGKNKRPRVDSKSRDPDAWKEQCKQLLEMMFQCEDSEPFRTPVNPVQYPNYLDLIDTPIDLATIRDQLQMSNYSDPTEMCKDMRLLFQNSKEFNTNKRSRIYAMTLRLSAMFEEKIRDVVSEWKLAVKQQKCSASNKRVKRRRITVPEESSETEAVYSNVSVSFMETNPSTSACTADSSFSAPAVQSHSQTEGESSAGPSTSVSHRINKFDKKLVRRKKIPSSDSDEEEIVKKDSTNNSSDTVEKEVSVQSSSDDKTEEGSTTEDLTDVEGDENKENRLNVRTKKSTKLRKQSAKPKLLNGHMPKYMTRTSTGNVPSVKYTNGDPIKNKSDSDSDTESDERPSKISKPSNRLVSSSSSSSDSSSSDSEPSSESDAKDSDYNLPESVPLKNRTSTKRTPSNIKSAKKKIPLERRSQREKRKRNDDAAKGIRTRNQGRRTVQYGEDTGGEEDDNDDDDDSDGNESDTESDSDTSRLTPNHLVSRSSRGRLRKPTARARASLLGE